MDNNEIKKVEEEIKKEDKKIENEIKEEEKEIKTIENKELQAIKSLEKREEISKNENLNEFLIRISLDYGILYFILIIISIIFLLVNQVDATIITLTVTGIIASIDAFLRKKKLPFYILLIIAVIIGVIIRTASLPALGASPLIGNNYLGMGGSLNGLDPYSFYGAMLKIIATGNVPAMNYMRYLPIGISYRNDELLISFFGAYLYEFLHPIIQAAQPMTWFMLYPPLVTIFTTILIFLTLLYIFRKYWVAVIGSFIFPAFQTALSRDTAGFSTKTAMGFMFVMLTFFMFVKILTSKKTKTKVLYGFLMALALSFSVISSGYAQYPLLIIPISFLALIALGYDEEGDLYSFLPLIIFIPIQLSFMNVTLSSLEGILYFPIYITYVVVLFKLFVFNKYKDKFKFLKIPHLNEGASAIIYSLIIILILLAVISPHHLISIFNEIGGEFSHPLGVGIINPVTQTIAEYGTMTLSERFSEYSFFVNGIPVNFLLFYLGSVILLYLISKFFKRWYAIFLITVPFLILLNGGPYSPSIGSDIWFTFAILVTIIPLFLALPDYLKSKNKKLIGSVILFTLISLILTLIFIQLNQQGSGIGQALLAMFNVSSQSLYKYAAAIVAIVFVVALLFDRIEKHDIKSNALLAFLFVFFFLAITISNVELRLLQPTDYIAVLLVPFAIVFLTEKSINIIKNSFKSISNKEKTAIVIIIILIAASFVVSDLYVSLITSYQIAQSSGSGLTLWGPTLLWIKENTPTNSSLISWWDYGYWEENIANRTTVADGSNSYHYQSMIAKYFFEATSPYEYATYLHFIHQPTYAVISGSEVLKFSAISTIALEPTEFSPMEAVGVQQNTQNIGNKDYQYVEIFGGQNGGLGALNAPMNQSGEFWSAPDNILYEVFIPFNYSSTVGVTAEGNPYGVVYNTEFQTFSPILPIDYNCVYSVGCKTVNLSGIPGGVMLLNASSIQTLHLGEVSSSGYIPIPINISQYGNQLAVLFMPNDTLNTLFTKLYLLNESVPGFKLVFSDGLPVNSLLSINNQVLTNVNVYEINYTELSKYELTNECSTNPNAINYCDNLSYLPSIFSRDENLIENTTI